MYYIDLLSKRLQMKYLLFSCALFLMPLALISQSAPLLEIDGISGGLRLPRLSNAERDALEFPGSGTTIYNTSTGCLNYYTGTFWSEVCGKPIGVSTCYATSDCPSGFYCDYAILVDCNLVVCKGVCLPNPGISCESDQDCPEGYFCMITSVDSNGVGQGVCVSVSESTCESDEDCPEGYHCAFLDGYLDCVLNPTSTCESDNDCALGYHCAFLNGYLDCVPNCTKDSQCPAGYRCQAGKCVVE